MNANQPAHKKIYLIDISSLFFRSYYAISLNMKNEKGLATNALYGVLKMLHQLSKKKSPDHWISCFDTKTPSFRKKLYPEYKANRGEMPEDLEVQVPYLKIMMDKLLIPYWEKAGFEADDLIASLANSKKVKNWETYIVSGDKDFAQIVDSKTFLYDTMKDVVYDSLGVEEKWGVPPSQMQDYLSLIGDSSDNIPGVKGVGPKGAIQLLKSYKNLEGIYKNKENLKDSLKEKLLKDKEMAFLSRRLIALKKDIVYDKNLLEKKHKAIADFSQKEKQDLREFLEELNFKSFVKKFFPVQTESPKPSKDSWEESKKDPKKSKNNLSSETLTQSKNNLSSETLTQSKIKESPSKLKPFNFKTLKIKQVTVEDFKQTLEPYASVWIGSYKDQFYLASSKKITLIKDLKSLSEFLDYKWVRYSGHNLKFFWKKLQIKNAIAEWDSMVAGYLLDSSIASPSVKDLFQAHLDSSSQVHLDNSEEELDLIQKLSQEQRLQEKLLTGLQREEMEELFKEIELPLISVLYNMEKQGLLLDLKELQEQSQYLAEDIKNLEFQIHKMTGEKFNLSSPKQLAVVLFEKLKLPRGRKTKTGYSTDSYELMKIKNLHPVLPLLLEHRELFKLKSTYTDSLLSLRDKTTGRIYTEFKQSVASTGRLSSVNPNLQNIPIRTERGRLIRKAFIAEKGHQLICADYSQLELRILAHITGDKNLCKAFEEGLDVHTSTASEVFNVPLKEVSQDLRRKSKAINFGIAYGQGAYGLAENLSITRAEAKEIIDNYFKKYKKIKDYIESVKEELLKRNYVKTLYGRKRFFKSGDLKHPRFKAAIERAAINAPLQGTASDLVKKAMICLDESLPVPILSQVHDELLFEVPKECVERESKEIIAIMEKQDILKIPLKVNLASGKDWFIAHG